MKQFSREWYIEKNKEVVKEAAMLDYRDKIRVWLSLPIDELKSTPLYQMITDKYPGIEHLTLDEARIIKLFEKIFKENSQRALEFSYKLDGSMDETKIRVSHEDLYAAVEDIK